MQKQHFSMKKHTFDAKTVVEKFWGGTHFGNINLQIIAQKFGR